MAADGGLFMQGRLVQGTFASDQEAVSKPARSSSPLQTISMQPAEARHLSDFTSGGLISATRPST